MHDTRVHGVAIVEALEALYCELHARHAAVQPELCGMPARSGPEAWARRRLRYLRWFEAGTTFVVAAHARGTITGYAIVVLSDGYAGWISDGPTGEVKDLVVATGARRRGVAGALLAAAEDRLRDLGVEQVRLNVLTANEEAAGFYARRGLIPRGHLQPPHRPLSAPAQLRLWLAASGRPSRCGG